MFASLVAASTGIAACGWLLPDGVLETAESDAAVEDSDSNAGDAGVDSSLTDAGDPKWGEPVRLRNAQTDLTIALRLGPHGGYYYSENGSSTGSIYYAATIDGVGDILRFEAGALRGQFPAVTPLGPLSSLLLYQTSIAGTFGPLFSAQVSGSSDVIASPAPFSADGGVWFTPYILTNANSGSVVCYAWRDSAIIRVGVPPGQAQSLVAIAPALADAVPTRPSNPVVSRDERTIFFSAGFNVLDTSIWMATRSTTSDAGEQILSFVNAHRVFPDSLKSEFPTDISPDGKTLYFTRYEEGGSAVYSSTQLP